MVQYFAKKSRFKAKGCVGNDRANRHVFYPNQLIKGSLFIEAGCALGGVSYRPQGWFAADKKE